MDETFLTITTPDGPMDAFLALPDGSGRVPAVLVAQEAFGVNEHIRDVCRELARHGFAALAPELFHRDGRGIVVPYDDFPSARVHFAPLDNDAVTRDLVAALAALRASPRVEPDRVGVIGFCMGGFVAFLAACRTDVRSAVVFYGGGLVRPRPGIGLTPLVGEAGAIRAPVLVHVGDADASVPLSDVDAVRERLAALGKEHAVHVYPGAGHGFACDARPSAYRADAARLAWRRTFDWLARTLGGAPAAGP